MLRHAGCARSAILHLISLAGAIALLVAIPPSVLAQESSTGNISGTVTGPRGASVSGADVTITNKLTGQATHTTTSPAGTYAVRDLAPGDYVIHVQAKGFQPAELLVRIQSGASVTGDVRLQRLAAPSVSLVDTTSPAVRGSETSEQMEQLPTNRNFLELGNLQPGVQVVDGVALAPAKTGVSSVSIVGRSGHTTRTLADGVDITDETTGATTQNIPVSGVQELQIFQSSVPPPSTLGAAGVVNVVTKSGGNDFHGQLFGNARDKGAGIAKFPGGQANPYSREVFGGNVGGPISKDKLFFFLGGEYFKRDLVAPVVFNAPFTALDGSYHSPFRDTELDGRLDYKLSTSARLFYRFSYDNLSSVDSFAGSNFQVFKTSAHAPTHTVGLDFGSGASTHSIRFGYMRFSNGVADAVDGSGIPNVAPGISLNFSGGSGFASGPSPLAPRRTIQENKEVRYDGTRIRQSHTFRYGFELNKIDDLVLANFYGLAPEVGLDTSAQSMLLAASQPGGVGNPLSYRVNSIILGNGISCLTEKSAFGSPCGGVSDTRIQVYAQDSWKVRSNVTLTYGLQYVRDTGRSNSDLPGVSALNTIGNIPGLGSHERQPNLNFAPQIGVAWDPGKSGRTVFRAGIGLYYDNTVFSNVLYDRVARLANGQFNAQSNDPCAAHGLVVVPGTPPTNTLDATKICGNPVGSVAPAIVSLQQQFQAAYAALSPNSPNASAFTQRLSSQQGLLAPNFQTPRSVQMNLGFQKQIRQGTVFSVDYLRNVGTHYLLGWDTNHVGDAAQFQTNCQPIAPTPIPANCLAVLNAINSTIAGNSLTSGICPQATSAGSSSQTAVTCYLANVPGASIVDFATHGLDSGAQFLGGYPAALFSLTPQTGAVFGGVNPAAGRVVTFFPAGRSVYSGLEFSLRSQIGSPFRGAGGTNLQLSYTHASFHSNVPAGQDLLPLAADFNHPTAFFGSSEQDRKHQFAIAAFMDLPRGLRLGFIGRFESPLPQTLYIASSNLPGEIFRSDVTGDGAFGGQGLTGNNSYGDILPEGNIGSFGRSIKASNLNSTILNFNSNFAGGLTPAGRDLVAANLLTTSQLQALGATIPNIPSAPPGNVGLSWLRSFDLTLAWPLKLGERFTFEPRVSAFNLFNFANFDGPGDKLGGILNGGVGEVNGTTAANRFATRTGPGSGVFTLGSPRQLEFGVKVVF